MDSTVVYVTDKVVAALTGLAASLKVPAGHVYAVLVRQALVEGWLSLGGAAGAALLFVVGVLLARRFRSRFNDDGAGFVGTVGGIVAIFVAVIAFPVCVVEAIGRLYNPEYYALRELLSVLK